LVAITVETNQKLSEGVIEQRPDRVTEQPAQHRGNRADAGKPESPVRLRQAHRHQHHVRRNRENGALDKRDDGERPRRPRTRGKVKHPIVETAKHGGRPLSAGRRWKSKGQEDYVRSRARRGLARGCSGRMLTLAPGTKAFGIFSAIPKSRSRRSISFQ